MINLIINKMKDKKAVSGTFEYVVYFGITIMVVFLIIQVLFGVFSVFSTNVAASNVARAISIEGGFDGSDECEQIYNVAYNQLENQIIEDSLEIAISSDDSNIVLTADNLNGSFQVDLGNSFNVTVTSKIVLATVAGRDISAKVSSSSTGVGEVYFKND